MDNEISLDEKSKRTSNHEPLALGAVLDVERASALLAQSTDIARIKQLRDQAEALQRYLRAQRAGTTAAVDASVIARLAERRIGKLLARARLGDRDRGGGRPKTSGEKNPGVSPLKALGLTSSDSKRAHAAAALSEEDWSNLTDKARNSQKPIPANAAITLAREKRKANLAEESRSKPVRVDQDPVTANSRLDAWGMALQPVTVGEPTDSWDSQTNIFTLPAADPESQRVLLALQAAWADVTRRFPGTPDSSVVGVLVALNEPGGVDRVAHLLSDASKLLTRIDACVANGIGTARGFGRCRRLALRLFNSLAKSTRAA